VLPAGGDPLESAEVAMTYAEAGARQFIATRLDATRRLGGVLSAAHAAELILMGAGVSATIGGGLRALNPLQLARLVLPELDPDADDPEDDPAADAARSGPGAGAGGSGQHAAAAPAAAMAGHPGRRE
jgi:flagellar biosynthesis protein FlhF